MKLPVGWLKDYVGLDGVTVDELSKKLIGAGFEIEETVDQRASRRGVYTAEILSIEGHPETNRLDVCKVRCLGAEPLTIVTGAKNIKVGDIVPLAVCGAILPDGKEIGDAVFRGVPSKGMFCGGAELALTESDCVGASVDGVLIFPKGTPVGVDINDVLGFDDIVLDVAVTPNRPDCNSIIGLARETAAALGRQFKLDGRLFDFDCAKGGDIRDYIGVEVKDGVLCPRYSAAFVKDVKIAESPAFIKKRLRSVGIKSINNIVDITNYILFEIGQPMHAFDLRLIEGAKIIVRRAEKDEEIVSLDGKLNVLRDDMLVIADTKKPVAVAGIMGGLHSGISRDTTQIVFESARFKRDSIRVTSKALNLKSDSQARYEKGIDFLSQELALKRALSLVCQLKIGTVVSGVIDSLGKPPQKTVITTTTKKINGILGITVPDKDISAILNSLEIETVIDKNGVLTAKAPLYREDIQNVNDLSEEVIRLYGYDKIVPTLLDDARQTRGGKSQAQKTAEKLKTALTGLGFNEIISFSFTTAKAFDNLGLALDDKLRTAIKILNPLSEDLSVMRTTLVHSVINAAAYNINKGAGALRLFENSAVYLPKSLPLTELPDERARLGLAVTGEGEDFFSIKGVIETIFDIFGIAVEYKRSGRPYLHPGRSADVYYGAEIIGSFGEVHPDVLKNYNIKDKRVYVAELDSGFILTNAVTIRKFRAAPKYPSIERDVAIIIDDGVEAGHVVEVIKKYADKDLLEDVKIFDVFKGEQIAPGKKSLALSLVFRSCDRTLSDAEAKAATDAILNGVKNETGGVLR